MTETDDIRARLEAVCSFIQEAIAKVDSGVVVNLAGMDDDVAALCERTLALPPAQAMEMQPLMADMIGALDRLGQSLRDFQERTKSGKAGQ